MRQPATRPTPNWGNCNRKKDRTMVRFSSVLWTEPLNTNNFSWPDLNDCAGNCPGYIIKVAHAPARLKKELDSVLKLQSTIDTTDDVITCLADRFSKSTLESLARTQERLKDKAFSAGLRPQNQHLKAGGTKIHQSTRDAIAKRKLALLKLAAIYCPEWGLPLPEALPVKLDALQNSSSLLEDIWIMHSPQEIPRWLDEVEVRVGIRAMLKVDHCLEERRRLGQEADNLCRWFGQELLALEAAVLSPSNQPILVLLETWHAHLLSLKCRWTNVLASGVHFESHVQAATDLKHRMPTFTPTSPATNVRGPVTWLTPLTERVAELTDADPAYHAFDFIEHNDMARDTGEVLFADLIDAELDDDNESFNDHLEQLPPQHLPEDPIKLVWDLPDRFVFDEEDILRFETPRALLNDVCINSTATLFQHTWSRPSEYHEMDSRRCAIFSTFNLHMVHYNCPLSDIWHRTSHLEFWHKDIWLLPIHRPCPAGHWVLAVILVSSGKIFLFDSFTELAPWKHEISEIMLLITRLVLASNHNGHPLHIITEEGWSAQPLLLHAVQNNGHSYTHSILMPLPILFGMQNLSLAEEGVPCMSEMRMKMDSKLGVAAIGLGRILWAGDGMASGSNVRFLLCWLFVWHPLCNVTVVDPLRERVREQMSDIIAIYNALACMNPSFAWLMEIAEQLYSCQPPTWSFHASSSQLCATLPLMPIPPLGPEMSSTIMPDSPEIDVLNATDLPALHRAPRPAGTTTPPAVNGQLLSGGTSMSDDILIVSCGFCEARNVVETSKDAYYVVFKGKGSVGIYWSIDDANAFVRGVPNGCVKHYTTCKATFDALAQAKASGGVEFL
ncbi:uncharacterized protein LACBIDRAFT_331574 [Laccaria bicolor S238N-H82]|uniref:Predicted protein n=1 Tax=Laccaria bicolor (strain S238N-H82 / ATCC MYA-4686) TaxID=486041 RepID=B0DPV8_LACBS|nr:uncharacterized protein LACBIDRAFT_331574 [Laccaria bicolor S238N-H82]EDR03522.1 predicted protein [Laccaria bicolor S238N-H82]|eukprot:XP_001885978.1 predicted protein [Laccaria bicolor S238N-H82]